jgi:hypothetical protein
MKDRGLCIAHAQGDRSILPQLAVNRGWLNLIKSASSAAVKAQEPPPAPPLTGRAKREAKRSRFARALRGEHTRAR